LSSSPDFTAPDTSRYPYNIAAHAVSGAWEPCRWHYWQVASLIAAPPNDDDLLFAPRLDIPLPLSDEEPLIHTLAYISSDFTPVRSFYVIGEGCPAPSDTPVPTPEATPSSKPIASVLQTANCRTGPTLDYPVRQVLMPGEQYPVIGRRRDGTSLVLGLVAIDDDIAWTPQAIRNFSCWVHIDLVKIITVDTNLVMIIDPDPPDLVAQPTATSALPSIAASMLQPRRVRLKQLLPLGSQRPAQWRLCKQVKRQPSRLWREGFIIIFRLYRKTT
jgi:hypothetical protein